MLLSLNVLIANNCGVVATSTLMCSTNLDKNIQFATSGGGEKPRKATEHHSKHCERRGKTWRF